MDDDGEKLVQEVIAENPVEEKGEREEWALHFGIGRKEDIHVAAGGLRIPSKPAPTGETNLKQGIVEAHSPYSVPVLAFLAVSLACIGVRWRHIRGKSRTH